VVAIVQGWPCRIGDGDVVLLKHKTCGVATECSPDYSGGPGHSAGRHRFEFSDWGGNFGAIVTWRSALWVECAITGTLYYFAGPCRLCQCWLRLWVAACTTGLELDINPTGGLTLPPSQSQGNTLVADPCSGADEGEQDRYLRMSARETFSILRAIP